MEDEVLEILERNFNESIEFDRNKATEELLILFGVRDYVNYGKNEAICDCENEYWKEDEGGDWYCTIHNK